MDFDSLLEILKWLWLIFEVVRYFIYRQKEKELVDSVESINQHLLQLEKSLKEKSDND